MQTLEYVVPPDKLVPNLLPELPEFALGQPVFATGFMVGLLEAPCMAALRAVLDAGEVPVGTRVDIAHIAATLPDAVLSVAAQVVGIHRRRFEFDVQAMDQRGVLVASGRIGQTVVTETEFQASWPKPHAAICTPEVVPLQPAILRH